jgi:cytoskeletal protein RodZ
MTEGLAIQSTSTPKAQFCELLKLARERHGLSIESVAQETKISKHFVASLESGAFENLPGRVFGRGFIKSIARYLKCDQEVLLRLYDDACSGRLEVATQPMPEPIKATGALSSSSKIANEVSLSDEPVEESKVTNSSPLLASRLEVVRSVLSPQRYVLILATIAAALSLGIFIRWVVSRPQQSAIVEKAAVEKTILPAAGVAIVGSNPAGEVNTTTASESDTADAIVLESGAPDLETMQDSRFPATQMLESGDGSITVVQKSASQTAVAFEQMLEVEILAPLEVRLTVDGKKIPNESFTVGRHVFKFSDRADLAISDASKIKLIYNGKDLGSLGNAGRRRKLAFQANPSESDFLQ